MNRTGTTGFFNDPETDDTLQNIRRDYLASKKNLQELLVTSPTTTRTRPLQVPTPPMERKTRGNDELLRQQLREGLRIDSRHPSGSLPPAARRDLPRKVEPEHYTEVDGLRMMVHDQQQSIGRLQRALEAQEARNANLEMRMRTLEHCVAILEKSPRSPYEPRNTEPPGAYESVDHDNTKVLLNLDGGQPVQRLHSNYDDSTTNLIKLSQISSQHQHA
ncbi:LADA_0C08086g1_1 [Lachancea dasiensis]|uniref:Spindle pole component 29 n=1 Tax=Lachancea dasiensis TaxID=1072105 RepID=A0A1G4IZT6_9SACH|nr:LADA_0C08086g1_1 [Lachancea dasiensis]